MLSGPFCLAVFMGMALAGCGNRPPVTLNVRIIGNPLGNPDSVYMPANITIHTGEAVKWIDRDDLEHTVTPDRNYAGWTGGSSILRHGQSYSHTFTRAGLYRYHCMVHQNMFGTVRVEPAPSSG